MNIHCRGCAHTAHSAPGQTEWFSLELPGQRKLSKVQIARRMQFNQGQNIGITVGPSRAYDPREPLCLPEIAELKRKAGLQDYVCTGNLHSGKYVKISSNTGLVVLCEVKVFTLPE